MLGLARPRKIVEMTIGKLSYEFCRGYLLTICPHSQTTLRLSCGVTKTGRGSTLKSTARRSRADLLVSFGMHFELCIRRLSV